MKPLLPSSILDINESTTRCSPLPKVAYRTFFQPQQQIINSAIPTPTTELIENSLSEKLNTLTKDQTISEFIIDDLSYEEQFYYEKNFDLINKELLKKVKMPTSKQEFLINLTMVLNSDKHRNSVEAIRAYVPGGPPAGPPAPPAGPPVPPAGPPVPPAGPPIPAPRAKTRSKTFSVPANIQLLIDQLNIIKKT